MSDNARPVLYDADYAVTLANRAPAGEQVLSRVVGNTANRVILWCGIAIFLLTCVRGIFSRCQLPVRTVMCWGQTITT